VLSFLATRHLADSAEILADLVPWIYRASISFAYYPLWLAGVREGAAPLWCLRVRFLTFPRLVFFFPYAQSFAALLQKQRETGLHAPESGAAQTRLASEGLAVEQLGALH
jgi:hypothetical protein